MSRVLRGSDSGIATLPGLFATAAEHPDGELTIIHRNGASETRSYERLLEEGLRGAGALRKHGIGPGHRVAIVASTSFDFVLGCLSIWAASATVVSIPLPPAGRFSPQQSLSAAQQMVHRVAADAVITTADHGHLAPPGVRTVAAEELAASGTIVEDGPLPESPALIQFTSGSTSAPRGVILSHRAVASFARSYRTQLGFEPTDRLFSWLPLYHDLGFINYLVMPLTTGMSLTLLPTASFLADHAQWMVQLSRTHATHTAAPNFAFGLAARSIRRGLPGDVDLAGLRIIGSGGELIRSATIREFMEAAEGIGLAPDTFLSGYGLAEATCAVSTRAPGSGLKTDLVDRTSLAGGEASPARGGRGTAEFVAVGQPLPDVDLKIWSSGRDLEERAVGEILLRGSTIMDGYLDDPSGTEAALVDGWLHTGDLGYVADGELYVTGRAKDMIVVRGENYFAEDIERVAERVEGVRVGCCVAVPIRSKTTEEIGLIAETRLESAEDKERCHRDLMEVIREETGIVPRKVLLVESGTVPKTSSGKLQRSRARQLLDES